MGSNWEIRDEKGNSHFFDNFLQCLKFLIKVRFKMYYIKRNFF